MPPFFVDLNPNNCKYVLPIKSDNKWSYPSERNTSKNLWRENKNGNFRSQVKYGPHSIRVCRASRDKWLVNLTGEFIPEDVLDIACLGEKFGVPIVQNSCIPIYKIIATIESQVDLLDEDRKNNVRTLCANVVRNFASRKAKSNYPELIRKINLTRRFKKLNPQIMFLKADKGNVTVIVNRDFYIGKMSKLLSDTSTYKVMQEDSTPLIQKRINRLIINWYKQELITEREKVKFSSRNGNAARAYGLPKIHKKDVPFRIIVSFVGTPTYELAKYLQRILTDCIREEMTLFNKNKTAIISSTSLVKKIRNLKLPKDYTMISMDVVSLFTNVPLHLVIFGIRKRWKLIEKYTNINQHEFIKAISLCFNASAFQFNGIMYQQVFGAAMGSPLSPIIAEIVLQDLEDCCLKKLDFPIYFYTRYVDDVLVFLPENKINSILSCFNSYHERLKFTVEREENNRINFLEVTLIKNNGEISVDWYRKPTFSGRYLNYNSYHPESQKHGTIYNLTDRAILLSDTQFHLKNLAFIKYNLIENGYPKKLIIKIISRREKKLLSPNNYYGNFTKREKVEDIKYMTLPYVENLSEELQYHLKKFRIRLSFKNDSSLGWLFTGSKDKLPLSRRTNTIYKIPCLECNFVFIDHTKQQLGTRVNEHYQSIHQPHVFQVSNQLTEHVSQYKHNFNFTGVRVLAVEPHHKKRKLLSLIFRERELIKSSKIVKRNLHINQIYSSLINNSITG